ncbi:MAG: methyltransferase domain-containing protein [Candidatus Magasanikbacteria bacterium]|nr:methyltransferase domain-containing protein [Candidatus Magasanikbacteria bacterium]
MKLAFTLGHQPHISRAEIEAVLSGLKLGYTISKDTGKELLLQADSTTDATALMEKLGGTIKISICVETPNTQSDESRISRAANYLAKKQNGKIVFSLQGPDQKKIGLAIKQALKKMGRASRFVEAKNTASIIHNNLISKGGDLTLIDKKWYAGVAIQNIEKFSVRDYGRPEHDSKSGMLPPKLARIMVNLAGVHSKARLLDPFCGSGTVLVEALSLKYLNVSGSDISEKAVEDSKKNLSWFMESMPSEEKKLTQCNIQYCDARSLNSCFHHIKFDAIVSEPYLGKTLNGKESLQQLQTQAKDLSTLYIESFSSFKKVLKRGAIVIFVIPSFKYNNQEWIKVPCLENIKKMGFKIAPFGPGKEITLSYHRPAQFITRNIYKFVKE